jgi:dTDP-4-amino-4,6-dideoxygalactose transaminase
VASGLDALTIGLEAMNLPKDSEVLVPSNTYIASIISIIKAGLKPVLAEPDIKTYNISPNEIKKNITNKTSAIMAVHLYGKPCEMDKICEIAQENNLKIIEDCAQAHGAKFKDKKIGTFGDVGAFSFYPTKNLGALGDAGGIITNNEEIINNVKTLRNYGSNKKYYNEMIGHNSRLDEIQAAFLRIKLKNLDKITEHKRKLAYIYNKKLKNVIKPIINENYFDVYHLYVIRHEKRDKLKQYLLNNGVGTEIHYPLPPHKQKALQGFFNHKYPISEELHNTVLSLPLSYCHTEEDIEKVIELINKF